jgi:hypothetical protein
VETDGRSDVDLIDEMRTCLVVARIGGGGKTKSNQPDPARFPLGNPNRLEMTLKSVETISRGGT